MGNRGISERGLMVRLLVFAVTFAIGALVVESAAIEHYIPEPEPTSTVQEKEPNHEGH